MHRSTRLQAYITGGSMVLLAVLALLDYLHINIYRVLQGK